MSSTGFSMRLRRKVFVAMLAATFVAAASNETVNSEGGVQTPGAHLPASLSGYIIAVG
jgi:hypothetical protein